MSNEAQKRVQFLKSLSRKAQPLLMEGFNPSPGADPKRLEALAIDTKRNFKDLVTEYDKKVEAFLIEAIQKEFPGELIIGEESTAKLGKGAREQLAQGDAAWILDPIDGTTNYAKAYPFFCSTASWCQKNSEGILKAQAATTYNPVSDELFWASKDGGCHLNDSICKVSASTSPQEALLCTGFASLRSQSSQKPFELFEALTQASLGVRRDGSAALDMAYVACGRLDAYWEWGLSCWDMAAGALLIQEAGGQISHLNSKKASWDMFQGDVVCSNQKLHTWLLEQLES